MNSESSPERSLETYLVETGGQTWSGVGRDMNEGVRDAFRKIIEHCHKEKTNTQIDLTFTVRKETEPKSKAIRGKTIPLLVDVGEITNDQVRQIFVRRKNDGK